MDTKSTNMRPLLYAEVKIFEKKAWRGLLISTLICAVLYIIIIAGVVSKFGNWAGFLTCIAVVYIFKKQLIKGIHNVDKAVYGYYKHIKDLDESLTEIETEVERILNND